MTLVGSTRTLAVTSLGGVRVAFDAGHVESIEEGTESMPSLGTVLGLPQEGLDESGRAMRLNASDGRTVLLRVGPIELLDVSVASPSPIPCLLAPTLKMIAVTGLVRLGEEFVFILHTEEVVQRLRLLQMEDR